MVGTASGGEKCIAMAVNATFHISTQLEDSSTKDSVGDWQEQDVTGLSWDAQTESLVTLEDNGTNGELPQDILSLMINKTKVTSSSTRQQAPTTALLRTASSRSQAGHTSRT